VKANAEVAIHGGLVEGPRVVLVELVDGLVPESAASEDGSAVVNMSVEDHEQMRVVRKSPEELARICEVSGVADVAEWSRSKMRLDGLAP